MHPHLAHLKSFSDEPIVFLTVVTYRRRALLTNEHAMGILRDLWSRSLDRNGWAVGDFLLMPDHLHLFARGSRSAISLSKWVQLWKSMSSRQLLAINKLSAPFWQKDYFDRFLRNSENYSDKWQYVAENPVRAGMVETSDDWPFKGRICHISY